MLYFGFKFKELMLSIDQEEKIDENKPNNAGGSKSGMSDPSKLAILQQKLFEGIERTTTSKNNNGQDSTQATPRSKAKSSKNVRNSAKKGGSSTPGGPRSATKRKRKNDSDFSSASETNSDLDDEDY